MSDPALWQFRYVFADGRRGNWHCGLEFPRTINTGDSAGHGTTFEVRELFPSEILHGSAPTQEKNDG